MDFALLRPTSLSEVLEMMNEYPKARLKAGGTDLLVWIKKGLISADHVIDMGLIPEIKGIIPNEGEGIHIGAMATLSDVICHSAIQKDYPDLTQACRMHSDPLIRNQATVVGNVCSAVPSGDCIPPLLAHRALVHTVGSKEPRVMPLEKWIIAPRTTRILPEEVVSSVFLPQPEEGIRVVGRYLRISRRKALDLAQVGVCCVMEWKKSSFQTYLSYGAVSAVPFRCLEAEQIINEAQRVDEELLQFVVDLAVGSVQPISDVRASQEYRIQMVRELTRQALMECYLEGRDQ